MATGGSHVEKKSSTTAAAETPAEEEPFFFRFRGRVDDDGLRSRFMLIGRKRNGLWIDLFSASPPRSVRNINRRKSQQQQERGNSVAAVTNFIGI